MYYVCFSGERKLRFSVLARLSGTENKMSVKLYGTEDTRDLFADLAEGLFAEIAPAMKDPGLRACRDQVGILDFLYGRAFSPVPLDEIAHLVARDGSASEKAHLMMVVEALSRERLVDYDGASLQISERGGCANQQQQKVAQV